MKESQPCLSDEEFQNMQEFRLEFWTLLAYKVPTPSGHCKEKNGRSMAGIFATANLSDSEHSRRLEALKEANRSESESESGGQEQRKSRTTVNRKSGPKF